MRKLALNSATFHAHNLRRRSLMMLRPRQTSIVVVSVRCATSDTSTNQADMDRDNAERQAFEVHVSETGSGHHARQYIGIGELADGRR